MLENAHGRNDLLSFPALLIREIFIIIFADAGLGMEIIMANTFKLEILASDKPFYTGECEMLVFPAFDGEQGVLPRHESTVTCNVAGELRFKVDGEWRYAAVSEGIVEIMPAYVTCLVETAERPEDIDVKRAREAKERAEEQLRQKQSIQEYYKTQAALNRAVSRLKVTSKYRIG